MGLLRFSFHSSVRFRVAAATTVVAVLALTPAHQALANHGDDTSLPDRDNNSQAHDNQASSEAGRFACQHGAERLDTTEVNTYPGYNDIVCFSANYSWNDGDAGRTSCPDYNSTTGRCNVYHVKINTSVAGEILMYNHAQYRYIGCHEFGHTSAVGHRDTDADGNSCMDNGSGNPDFDSHDRTAIANDY